MIGHVNVTLNENSRFVGAAEKVQKNLIFLQWHSLLRHLNCCAFIFTESQIFRRNVPLHGFMIVHARAERNDVTQLVIILNGILIVGIPAAIFSVGTVVLRVPLKTLLTLDTLFVLLFLFAHARIHTQPGMHYSLSAYRSCTIVNNINKLIKINFGQLI